MKNLILIFLIALIHLLFIQSIKAELKLPAIISSNMVLQRNTSIELWGWADANEKITIMASWLEEEIIVVSDSEGNWQIEVETTNSKEPQTIQLKSEQSEIKLEDILFGEVWLCSGQSNMELPFKGYEGEPVLGSVMAVAKSNNPNLRLFTVEKAGSKTPLNDIEKYIAWQQASPDCVLDFSALAYFFGKQLQEILDCPVGLILSSYGGTSVQAWMSKEAVSKYQEVDLTNAQISLQGLRHMPTGLFNAMINPLIHYKIKGALWYQGEENRREPENYKKHFPEMVKDWRSRWGLGDFPFYYVQIAPYIYRNNNEVFQSVEDNSAFMREAQLQCLDLIPNSGIVITLDIGDDYNIHPIRKKEVADRLLFNALNQTYGFKTVDYASPIYDTLEIKGDGIILKFNDAEMGLYSFGALENFEIAGEDKVFYPAEARIGMRQDSVKRNEVLVTSDKVPNPVAVRYAWRNYIVGTLFGNNQIPVSSFRTDKWDDATLFEE